MKWARFILLVTALLFSMPGWRLEAAPNQLVPQGLGATITIPGMLSYKVPKGWSTDTETNASPQARGPISNGFTPDITFNPGNYGSLADLATTFQPSLYDSYNIPLKYVDQQSFVTAAGVKGVRLRAADPSTPSRVTQFSYIFLSADGQQLELACACATMDAAVYEPVFDASMKSIVIAKGD
jgi:hypothetical protein